jgi:pyruvate dehydrogenase E2 component (dihydrolipoamide acetyltransferase)
MEKPFTMPKLGMTMTEGTVLRWLYQVGDRVEKGEPLVEVMTDKVNIEVEAPFSGYLVEILAQEGDVLPIGAPLAALSLQAGDTVVTQGVTSPSTISSTSISRGDREEKADRGDQTPGRTTVASTPAAKREATLHNVDLQEVVRTGAKPPLERADIIAFVQSRQDTAPQEDTTDRGQLPVRATPIAQKIAREHHIDLAALAQLKPGGKVTRADVEAHLPAIRLQQDVDGGSPGNVTNSTQVITGSTPVGESENDYELIPLSPTRRLIGQRMLQSITSAPHIYLDTEIDMTEAERWRQRVGRSLQEQGEAMPSLTAVLIRAAAAALVLHPEVNASLEPGGLQGKDAIRRWRVVHIGIAVDTEQALLTPVIRNAHLQSLPAIAQELRRLSLAARQRTLKPDELAGATFTISNLGMYGIDTFHAIIAPGQSAILAVGKVTRRGVVVEDSANERLEIRPVMKVSLSADHRVLDGASGSRFLHRLKTFLENPYLLL